MTLCCIWEKGVKGKNKDVRLLRARKLVNPEEKRMSLLTVVHDEPKDHPDSGMPRERDGGYW